MGKHGKRLPLWVCNLALLAATIGGCASSQPFAWNNPQRPSTLSASTRTAIVVDIDETLSHTDYFDLILRTGKENSRPLNDAKETLARLANDFDIIYLTSRPTYLFHDTRGWLLKNGFPDGPVYTAHRLTDLLSVRRYKTRHLADLRNRYPNALIGIGDRASDGRAYQSNGMLSVIVNPNEDCHFNSRDVVLRAWSDVATFFEANADLFQHPANMRSATNTQRFGWEMPTGIELVRYDIHDSNGRTKLNRAILRVFPSLHDYAGHQAGGAQALADECDLRSAMQMVAVRWPGAKLVGVRLGRTGGMSAIEAKLIHNEEFILAILDAKHGDALHVEHSQVSKDIARVLAQADNSPRITFLQAIELAAARVDGNPYSIQLRNEYRRPTYEVALLCRRGFWEVDIDVASGRLQEVDREWRLVPLN